MVESIENEINIKIVGMETLSMCPTMMEVLDFLDQYKVESETHTAGTRGASD